MTYKETGVLSKKNITLRNNRGFMYHKYKIDVDLLTLKYAPSVCNTTYKGRNVNNNIVVWQDVGDSFLCCNVIFSPKSFGQLSLDNIKELNPFAENRSISSLFFGTVRYSTYWTKWSKNGAHLTSVFSTIGEALMRSFDEERNPTISLWTVPCFQPTISKLSRADPLTLQRDEHGEWWLVQDLTVTKKNESSS